LSLREVTIRILGILLLIGCLGRLENLIYKTLKSVAVSSLELSLGMKTTNAIQEAFEFTQPGLVLLMMTRPLYRVERTVQLSLLVVAHG
jgi:hypothetical protein